MVWNSERYICAIVSLLQNQAHLIWKGLWMHATIWALRSLVMQMGHETIPSAHPRHVIFLWPNPVCIISFFYFRIKTSALKKNRFLCLPFEFFWAWITWYVPHSSLPALECHVGAKELHLNALWITPVFYFPKTQSRIPKSTLILSSVNFLVEWSRMQYVLPEVGKKEKIQYLILDLQIFQNIYQKILFNATCNGNCLCFNAGKVCCLSTFLFLVSGFFEMLTEQQMANLAVPFCVSRI